MKKNSSAQVRGIISDRHYRYSYMRTKGLQISISSGALFWNGSFSEEWLDSPRAGHPAPHIEEVIGKPMGGGGDIIHSLLHAHNQLKINLKQSKFQLKSHQKSTIYI